jgi:hypothetical protein
MMNAKLGQVYELDPGHASNQIGQQKNFHENAVCEISHNSDNSDKKNM